LKIVYYLVKLRRTPQLVFTGVLTFSVLAFSTLANRTCVFSTCIFHPCKMSRFVLAFSVLTFSSTCDFSAPRGGYWGSGAMPPIHLPKIFKRINTENVQKHAIFAQVLVILARFWRVKNRQLKGPDNRQLKQNARQLTILI